MSSLIQTNYLKLLAMHTKKVRHVDTNPWCGFIKFELNDISLYTINDFKWRRSVSLGYFTLYLLYCY